MEMRAEYNETLIFYINTLKKQKVIGTWAEGAQLYYEVEKKEISPSALSSRSKSLVFSTSVNPQLFFTYCDMTEKLIKKEEKAAVIKKDEVSFEGPLTRTLSIPREDYGPVFGVDLDKDAPDVIKRKIQEKIADDIFLLTYLGFNPGRFEVQKINMGGWTTPVKTKNDGKEEITKVQNDKFTIIIGKKKNPVLYYTKEECDNWLNGFLSDHCLTPFDFFGKTKTPVKKSEYNRDLMMVSPGLELHLGKLATMADHEDYSTKQAMWRIVKVVYEMVEYQRQQKASGLILGIGNDYFNSDTVDDKTTAGIPQHNDTRFKEIYLWGKVGYLQMIETLKTEFDKVIVKGNPGNHDEKSSFSLFTNIYDIYNQTKDPKVQVDFGFKDLRYSTCQSFGDNLIVFSHGKSPEGKNLNDKKIAENIKYQFPEEFSKAKNVYVFVGHLHQDSEQKFDNVTVIRTASLTGIDSWHSANLFLGQRQGHSVYLIDKTKGYVGKRNITLSEEEKYSKIPGLGRRDIDNVYEAMKKTLNLNTDTINKQRADNRLKEIEKEFKSIDKKYNSLINEVVQILGDGTPLDPETLESLKGVLGYPKETEQLETEKVMLLKARNKKGK